jgi:hypothetical protein
MVGEMRWRCPGAGVLGWALLFFVCLQVALAVPMEKRRPELRDLEYGSKRARLEARRAEKPGHPLLVVVGSSRTNHGFAPGALPQQGSELQTPVVFNASLMGSGPLLELLCLRRLVADGLRPDWVLLECWPPFLQQEGARAEIYKIPVARLGYRDLKVLAPYYPQPQDLYREWGLARMAPWSSSRFILLTQFARDWLPRETRRDDQWALLDGNGWLPYQGSPDPALVQIRLPRVHEQLRSGLDNYRVSETADRALRESLAFCRQQGIGVALLYMPESRECQRWYPPGVREEADRYLLRVTQECRVPLVDARDWSPDADFGDGIHLLPRGAEAFTARFGRDVLPRLLRGELQ